MRWAKFNDVENLLKKNSKEPIRVYLFLLYFILLYYLTVNKFYAKYSN